jgi:proteasome component ECM29
MQWPSAGRCPCLTPLTGWVQLYLGEIVCRLLPGLASSSWSTKQQCAKAAAAAAQGAGPGLAPHAQALLKALLGELPGRLWDGKEAVLEAIGAICKACWETISGAEGAEAGVTPEQVVAAVVAAAGRKKASFKEAALACLEKVGATLARSVLSTASVLGPGPQFMCPN